ncbi:hypothetical protein FOA52_002084 [Chlamydomonas sp. UWO 241]|nr:hypothetical protein FOA52_002084 [Chlamydomonas sp. UWO 241]
MALREAFTAFASVGAGAAKVSVADMDSKSLIKVCKDSGLMGKNLTTTDVDLIFTQVRGGSAGVQGCEEVKAKGARRISYREFETALSKIAARKGMEVAEVETMVAGASPNLAGGTTAQANKFHDDKSLYTGVHANGGPSTKDDRVNLANLLDRSTPDVRGCKQV